MNRVIDANIKRDMVATNVYFIDDETHMGRIDVSSSIKSVIDGQLHTKFLSP